MSKINLTIWWGGGKIKTIFRLINLLVGLIGDYTLKIKLH